MPPRLWLLFYLGILWGTPPAISTGDLPAPTIILDRNLETSLGLDEQAVSIQCTAPSTYLEGTFSLYREGESRPVQEQYAPESKHSITFMLRAESDAGRYKCSYTAWISGQFKRSEFSDTVMLGTPEDTIPSSSTAQGNGTLTAMAPTWIVPVSVGGAIALLLGIVLAAVVVVKCVRSSRKRRQREKEPCWMQNTDISKTNLAYSSSIFEECMASDEKAIHAPEDPTCLPEADLATRKRLPSGSHFSTFRT